MHQNIGDALQYLLEAKQSPYRFSVASRILDFHSRRMLYVPIKITAGKHMIQKWTCIHRLRVYVCVKWWRTMRSMRYSSVQSDDSIWTRFINNSSAENAEKLCIRHTPCSALWIKISRQTRSQAKHDSTVSTVDHT